VKRRHGRLAVTHSLRFHPAFARIKEIVSGGVLGAIRQVTLHRRWCRGAGEAAGDIAAILAFQDLDFCHWLLDGTAVLPAVLDAAAAADSEACRLRYPAAAVVDLSAQRAAGGGPRVWREVNVECGLGEIACRVISASWMGDAPDAVERCDLTRAGAVRHLTVPRAIPLGVELGYRVGALERGETWLCPTPAETRTELALTAAAGWR
jgi:predicted dehydrogenase